MKLMKLFPMVGLLFSLSVTSAFAVGRDSAEDTTGKICQKQLQIKQEANTASAAPAASADPKEEPATGTSAL